jgi:4-hydroxy-tetrahydrodipicolinate reductase
VKVALNGRSGKVGSVLAPALEAAGHQLVERADAEAVVDFTAPEAVEANVRAALELGIPCVVGTTGWETSGLAELAAEKGVALFYAPNFAIGAVLMMRFAADAVRHLPRAEIVELHGEAKKDAPSGTARATAELLGGAEIHSVRLPGLVAHQEDSCSPSGTTPSTARRTCPASCSRSRSFRACHRGSR